MNYKLINEKLKNINALRRNHLIEKIGSTDEYDRSRQEICEIGEGIYVKLDIYVDSYEENETITGITFVQPQEVKVTNFIDVE